MHSGTADASRSQVPEPLLVPGVLCIPFDNSSRTKGESERLKRLRDWLVNAGKAAGIDLREVAGDYSSESVIHEIFRRIQQAHIVVVAVREANPNVFFEAGYAIGWDKPVLYVAHEKEEVPFDIASIERFVYDDIDAETEARLARVMRQCIDQATRRAALSADLSGLRQYLAARKVGSDLYGKCLRHAMERLSKWVGSWSDHSCEFLGAHDILETGTFILENLQDGGFATQNYRGQESWEADGELDTPDEYFEATRAAVKRGRDITRIYVIDQPEQIHENAFRQTVWKDVAAGIRVKHILRKHLPATPAQDFGLWDDQLLGEVEYTSAGGTEPRLFRCTYSNDDNALTRAREWKTRILARAEPVFDLPGERELLQRSATETYEDCGVYCKDRSRGKADCSAYHLAWQRLRRCGLVSTPSWHTDFYSRSLRQWTERAHAAHEDKCFKVLISGLADYGMLYWTAQCIEHRIRKRCEFHVLDICETPLKSCQWLERRLQECNPSLELSVYLHPSDIFQNGHADHSYDLIVSDAFLTRFDGLETKARLMSEWLRLLGPSGAVLTTARVKEAYNDIQPADREDFVQRAGTAAVANGCDFQDITELAAAYASYIESSPFESQGEVRGFLNRFSADLSACNVEFRLLKEREMTKANYARIELRSNP